jgi:hypothetical protein
VDFLRGTVEVRRQVKLFANNRQVFALPKGRKTRTVPLPASVRDMLAAYLAEYPARTVELPWENVLRRAGEGRAGGLDAERKALNRKLLHPHIWKVALVKVGVEPSREKRYARAPALVRLGSAGQWGESIRAVMRILRAQRPRLHAADVQPTSCQAARSGPGWQSTRRSHVYPMCTRRGPRPHLSRSAAVRCQYTTLGKGASARPKNGPWPVKRPSRIFQRRGLPLVCVSGCDQEFAAKSSVLAHLMAPLASLRAVIDTRSMTQDGRNHSCSPAASP